MLFYLLEACGSIELPQRFLSGVEGWDRGIGSADPLLDAITSEKQFASAPVHLYLRV